MADINLEAEQVVGEEEEAAPRKRSGLLANRKTYVVVGAIVIVEAIVFVLAFGMMGGGDSPAEAKTPELAPVDRRWAWRAGFIALIAAAVMAALVGPNGDGYRLWDHIEDEGVRLNHLPCYYFNMGVERWECSGFDRTWE